MKVAHQMQAPLTNLPGRATATVIPHGWVGPDCETGVDSGGTSTYFCQHLFMSFFIHAP